MQSLLLKKVDVIGFDLNKAKIELYKNGVDPWASEHDAMHEYGVTLTDIKDVKNADCIIVAVAHNEFKAMSLNDIKNLFVDCPDDEKVLLDFKGLYSVKELEKSGMKYWRL